MNFFICNNNKIFIHPRIQKIISEKFGRIQKFSNKIVPQPFNVLVKSDIQVDVLVDEEVRYARPLTILSFGVMSIYEK